jgi:F-type H+-transporting ATPase subunit delta
VAEKFAKSYVDALFDVAGSAEAVEKLLPGLDQIADLVRSNAELKLLVADPKVPRDVKSAIIGDLGEKVGLGDLGIRFLWVLLSRRRLQALGDVLGAVRQRLDADRNIVEASVESAAPLSDETVARLVSILRSKTGSDIRLKASVSPEILGGVVRVGSEVYDASVAQRLERVRQSLLAVS